MRRAIAWGEKHGYSAACPEPDPIGFLFGDWRGAVAQMGERCNRTAEVRGSIPLSSTSPGSCPLPRKHLLDDQRGRLLR